MNDQQDKALGRNEKSGIRTFLRVSGYLAIAVVVIFLVAFVYGLYSMSDKVYELIDNIENYSGQVLVLERPLFIVPPTAGWRIQSFRKKSDAPKSLEEHKKNPEASPCEIIDEISPGTQFKIKKFYKEKVFAAGTFTYFTIEILSGKFAGQHLELQPEEILDGPTGSGSSEKWRLSSMVKIYTPMKKVP